jgi:putative FmdB family regulatory protein
LAVQWEKSEDIMPLYDYKCANCHTQFEARHGFDDPTPTCPNCGYAEVQRLILSAPAVNQGMLAHPGDGRRASREQLQDKWAEETPKLRKQLADKLGEDAVRSIPSLNTGAE